MSVTEKDDSPSPPLENTSAIEPTFGASRDAIGKYLAGQGIRLMRGYVKNVPPVVTILGFLSPNSINFYFRDGKRLRGVAVRKGKVVALTALAEMPH